MPKTIPYIVDFKLPFGDVVSITVKMDAKEHGANANAGLTGMLEIVEQIVADARKAAAARQIDYESSGGDSDYLDALDRYGDKLEITDIRRAGELRRFEVDAQYDDDQPFNDYAMAVDESDAEWRAAWNMALNTAHNASTPEDFASMLSTMGDYQMFWAKYDPVNKDELTAILAKLYSAVEAGDTSEAMAEAKDALEKLEALPETAPVATPAM